MNDFKEQVRDAVDLREVVERYGVDLKRVNSTSGKCCCLLPGHNEKTPSCHVHPDYFHCFGCGESGDVFSFIMDRERVEFYEALRIVADMVNMPMPQRDPARAAEYEKQRARHVGMREVLELCQVFYRDCLENQPVGKAALEYCNSRGWTKPVREQWGIGFAPDDVMLLEYLRHRCGEMISAPPAQGAVVAGGKAGGGQGMISAPPAQGTVVAGMPASRRRSQVAGNAGGGDASEPLALPVGDLENVLLAAGMMGQSDSGFRYMRFKSRVMFPVHDGRGRLCGFSGRWMRPADWDDQKKDHAKYLNTPVTELFDKGGMLYGLNHAAKGMSTGDTRGTAIVVEGQPDVIGCHMAGFVQTVAPMGTSLTPKGIEQLLRFTDNGKVTLVFDGDAAGIKATDKTIKTVLEMLTADPDGPRVQLFCATVPDGQDPDDIARNDKTALQLLIEKAPAWYVWLARHMLTDDDGDRLAEPVQAVHDYLELISAIESEVETDLALNAVVDLTGLKISTVKRQLKAIRTGRTSDGRALTSAENGANGGRPRNDYAGMADEYMGARLKCDIFTRRFYRGSWRRYSKGRWIEVTDDDMTADVMAWVRKYYRDLSETRTISNMLLNLNSADTGHIMSNVDAPVWLNGAPPAQGAGVEMVQAPGWIPMGNGLLNIPDAVEFFDGDELVMDVSEPSSAFIEPTPRLFNLNYFDYPFDPDAGCRKFLGYLEDVQPDPDARHVIRCMMGLMLVPETRFNVFFLLHGKGGTGKSVFIHVLNSLIGAQNCCTVPLSKLDDDHFTWQLTENLMNSIEDMDEVNLRDVEGTIKIATDGGFLDIRRLYKDGGRAQVIARTVASCNTLPRVHEKSNAMWDRLRVIPFDVKIRDTAKQNKNLKYEIVKDELPGIFIWALAGLAALRGQHVFPEHPDGNAVKDKHRGECDPTAVFLREFYELNIDSKILSSEIYGHYKSWAAENGYKALAAGSLNRDITRVFGVDKKKLRIGDRTGQGFPGLRRNPDTYAPVDDELVP